MFPATTERILGSEDIRSSLGTTAHGTTVQREERNNTMYIGIGTIVAIILIILIVRALL
jgi:hypothetical protein